MRVQCSGRSSRPNLRVSLSRGLTLISAGLTCAFILTGCLLDRIQQVQAQSCDFEQNFTYESGAVTSLRFHDPVILKTDVERLVGFDPVETSLVDGRIVQRYHVAQLTGGAGAQRVYEFEMRYDSIGDDARLMFLRMPAEVGLFMDRPAMKRAALKACRAEWRWAGRSIRQDLTPEDMALIPSQAALRGALGEPTGLHPDGRALSYAFHAVGTGDEGAGDKAEDGSPGLFARMTIHYDDDLHTPLHLESMVRGVRAEADFRSLEATVTYLGGRAPK